MPSVTFYKQIAKSNQDTRHRYAVLPKLRVGPATLGVITIVIVLLMSLLYLIQANSTATKGFEIEKEQEKIKTLESQAEKLELEMARLRSTKELETLPQKLNLKPLPEGEISSIQLDKKEALAGITSDKAGFNPKR